MKRLFLILLVMTGITFTAEKNNNQKNKKSNSTPHARTTYMLSSLHVHDLMANRQLAPHVACLLLWGDFQEEVEAFFRK